MVKIDDESSWALLDSGSTINVVTPEFIKAHSLDVGSLSNLVDGTLKINGFGGLFSCPLGYVIIRAQVEGVKGYDKDLSCPSHPRFNCLWIESPSYPRYTYY